MVVVTNKTDDTIRVISSRFLQKFEKEIDPGNIKFRKDEPVHRRTTKVNNEVDVRKKPPEVKQESRAKPPRQRIETVHERRDKLTSSKIDTALRRKKREIEKKLENSKIPMLRLKMLRLKTDFLSLMRLSEKPPKYRLILEATILVILELSSRYNEIAKMDLLDREQIRKEMETAASICDISRTQGKDGDYPYDDELDIIKRYRMQRGTLERKVELVNIADEENQKALIEEINNYDIEVREEKQSEPIFRTPDPLLKNQNSEE